MSNQKDHYRSLELETRVSSNPEDGDLLVCQFPNIENLESTESIYPQNHPDEEFLLMKSAEGLFQSGYQPVLV